MESKSAELAKTAVDLLRSHQTGVLSTHSLKHPGFPYASVVPYAISGSSNNSRPLFLMSSMATHTKNLKANGSAALLVAPNSNDPLSAGRVTLIGTVTQIEDAQTEAAKSLYVNAHPQAQQWASFGDFAMYQLELVDIYIVAGFGNMGWVSPSDLESQLQ